MLTDMQNYMRKFTDVFALSCLLLSAAASESYAANCDVFKSVEEYSVSGIGPKEARCSSFLNLNSRLGVACYWSFEFRDVNAREFDADLWADLNLCREGMQASSDQLVNHPDSYDLKELVVGERIYSVSIKDKTALGKTLVFLRIQ